MSALSNIIAGLTLLVASFVVSVLTLIHGYGLTVRSWSWIIWGSLAQLVLTGAISALISE
jgi:hypothetical protein